MAKAVGTAVRAEAVPKGRLFLETALHATSAAGLVQSFQAAAADEGVTRHCCTRHHADGSVELLYCDYPFDREGIAELGRVSFLIDDQAGSRVSVTMAGLPASIGSAKRARLHGMAMLYATCLPPLLDTAEPCEFGSILTEAERTTLMRLLLGESELDISVATGVSVRTVSRRISNASAKLGAEGPRKAIVVAAQRGLLNLHS